MSRKTLKEQFRKHAGYIEGHKCGECIHCVRLKYSNVHYKCELFMTSSSATGIKLKDTACKYFEKESE